MKTYLPFLILILLLNTGCLTVVKKIYGIKKPQIESSSSLKKSARKIGFKTSYLYTVSDSFYLTRLKGLKLPDAMIFDDSGRYIEYRSNDSVCNAGLFDFIPQLRKDGIYNRTSKTDLKSEFNKLRDLEGQKIEIPNGYDFYVLVDWAVWIGRLNKDHSKVWEELALENKNCRIAFIAVNMDFQKWWPETSMSKVKKAVAKKKR